MTHPDRERIERSFTDHFRREPTLTLRVPGRVSLLGGHIDYSEGPILAATIDRAIYLAAAPRDDGRLRAVAADLEEQGEAEVAAVLTTAAEAVEPPWLRYPMAAAWALAEGGFPTGGLEVAYGGDLPPGAGLSSSAAVEVAFLLAWRYFGDLPLDRQPLAALARRAENGFLGVQSGIMDPFTLLHGEAEHAVFLDCRDLSFRRIPVPTGNTLLIAESGVQRRLQEGGFNDRYGECRDAVEILRPSVPGMRSLRDLSFEDWQRLSHHLPMTLRRRSRHAVEEMERVRRGAEALDRGDLTAFGAAMRLSHLSSRDLYEVSLPELDVLATTAWGSDGCWGARLSGGGFGGCVTVWAQEEAAPAVLERLQHEFFQHFERRPKIHLCRLAEGVDF